MTTEEKAKLFDKLVEFLHGTKWDDVFPFFTPYDEDGSKIEKYIDKNTFAEVLSEKLLQ